MEINKMQDVIGVVATEDIVEGRMVLLTSSSETYNFGSRTDLPGIKVPATAAEALNAKYVSGFPMDNRPLPLMIPTPSVTFSLRQGFGGVSNVPFAASVYLSHRENLIGATIPSGELALAYAGGVFTVTSGHFEASADLVPGAKLEVLNTADDTAAKAGKLSYSASGTIAVVERYDSTNLKLTFRTAQP